MNCNKKPFTTVSIHDVDVDDLATTPDYFLGVREVEDATTGTSVMTPVRIPGARVMPTANLANVIALVTNSTSLEIPEGQILAGYYDAQPGGNVMKLADATHPAQFMMIKNYTNGKMLVQATGFLNMPKGHGYIPLTQYYLGEDGQPVTDSTVTGQKLFFVLDDETLNINGGF